MEFYEKPMAELIAFLTSEPITLSFGEEGSEDLEDLEDLGD